MNYILLLTVTLLVVIALLHFYWGFGGQAGLDAALPTKDGKRTLNPSKPLTFLVAFIILVFAFVVYSLGFGETSAIYVYLGWSVSAIFFIRAVGDFNVVGLFKKTKGTKFARYDTKYFTPLCLYLSFSIALLAYEVTVGSSSQISTSHWY